MIRSNLIPRLALLCASLLPALWPSAGQATTVSDWTPLYKGVDYATATNSASESPGPLNIFTVRIALHTPGISFTTSPSAAATYPGFETFSQTTGDFVNASGAKIGINANFFSVVSTTAQPQNLFGTAVSNGTLVSPPEANYPALLLTQNNDATLTTTPPEYDLTGVWNAVAGSSIILQNGVAVTPPNGTAGDPFNPNPRSAAGISQDGAYLYLMVIDGRTTASVGCTQAEAGGFLSLFGAYNGLNLDGGGSSNLIKATGAGVSTPLNAPSGGSQRLDGNSLVVFADALPVAPAPVLPYSQTISANSPVAYYRFNETSGAVTATDSSGQAHDAAYPASGVTSGIADQPIRSEAGTSATFNGAAGSHVTVPYFAALNPGSFTVEAWVKPTTTVNAFQGIVSNRDDKGGGAQGNAGYILYLGPATGDGGTPRWQFWTGGTTSATYTALGRNTATGFGLGPAVTSNVWTHVVGTFAATSGPDANGRYTGTQSLYVNGALAISMANVNYLPNSAKTLYIGAGNNELQTTDGLRFTGGIDEVAIYNTALTAAQIQARYLSGTTVLSAPSVTLTSPANGATEPFGATINLIADASDTDGSVTKVEFFDGATKLGEDTTAPFSFSWTGVAPGSHSITLKATDDSTLTTTSSATTITVEAAPNVAPTVSLTAPANGASFLAGSTVALSANAADSDGTVAKVEFFQGSTKLGEDTSAPFTFSWASPASGGSYTLTAVATDNGGATTTSGAITIALTLPSFSYAQNFDGMGTGTAAPSGWSILTALGGGNASWISSIPVSGAQSAATAGTANATLLVNSAAENGVSGINTQGHNLALSTSTSDRALGCSPTSGAGIIFQLILTNNSGAALNSLEIGYDLRRFTAGTAENELPGLQLFYSLNGTTWTNVAALNPVISGGTVNVPNTVGVTTVSPTLVTLASSWANGAQIRFRWIDDNAQQSSPDQIIGLDNVIIRTQQLPPTVALTAPANGAAFTLPNPIQLAATAADADGTVTKVEFFRGATKLGEDTTAPYEFTWSGMTSGSYTLTAVATDNAGASTTSAPVSITVTNPVNSLPSVALTSPANEATIPASSLTLTATAADTDGTVTKVEFFRGATKLGEDTTAPYEFTWTGIPVGTYSLTAKATDNDGGITTSAAYTIHAVAFTDLTRIDRGSVWKYLDNGTDQGTAWKETAFDDSAWASGPGKLGYEDGAVTILRQGPSGQTSSTKYITYYFRRTFNIADASKVLGLKMNLLRDDGAVIYINGTEVARSNMPTGAVNYLTQSATIVSNADETTYFPLALPTSALVTGDNVIAISLHQRDNTSSDLGLDLDLIATVEGGNALPTVQITSPASGATFFNGGDVAIAADAQESDGTVAKVEFFQGSTKLGEDTTAPFEFNWAGVTAGTYSLTAKATDAQGATGTSNPVSITVTAGPSGTLTRGPYLQKAGPNRMTIRWRSSQSIAGRVRYGSSPTSLDQSAVESAAGTEHEIELTGLTPNATYYYSIGSAQDVLASGSDYTFTTPPVPGTTANTRVWVLGDAGTANSSQTAVRDAFYSWTGSRNPNLVLQLGDNAYNSGTDTEFQGAVFNMYSTMLRKVPFWSCLGNHETGQAKDFVDTYPYFQVYTFPTAGECGGVASGTEHYYSWDYGNIHFISLDSMTASRSATGAMATWLQNDLASTTATWIIAIFHHPPYTKGSHNSDSELELVEMRQNILPILEAGGVDMVLCGHSHCYERSYLLDGHYGTSGTITSAMKLNGGDGRPAGNGAYKKPLTGVRTHKGAVYAVAGSSGQISGGTLNHPAHFISLNNLGSLVLDINGATLNATFVRETGAAPDTFTIQKEDPDSTAPTITTLPADRTLAAGGTGTAVLPNLVPEVAATDNVGVTSITQSPIAGSVLSLGLNNVTITVKDAIGNTTTGVVHISVTDQTAPMIGTLPSDRSINTGANGTVALPDLRAEVSATDNVGVASVTQSPAPGTALSAGLTDVTLTVADAAGNAVSGTVRITVVDQTMPTISAPVANFTPLTLIAPATVPDYTAQAVTTDNVAVTSVTQTPLPGTATTPGPLTITLTARDAENNVASLNFIVTVNAAEPGTLSFASDVHTFNPVNNAGQPNLLPIVIKRANGHNGSVTVEISGGLPATPLSGYRNLVYGTDYQFEPESAPGKASAAFADSQSSATVQVRILSKAVAGKGRFALSLGQATGGATVGTPVGTLVTISAKDATLPTLTLTSPSTSAVAASFDVTGTVKENLGLDSLTVKLNGVAQTLTVNPLDAFVANSPMNFSAAGLAPENGSNALVIEAIDTSGNKKTVSKTVTYTNSRPELAGTYSAIGTPKGTPNSDNGGLLTISVTPTGTFSGKATVSGASVPVSGLLNNAGAARFKPALGLSLNLVDKTEFETYLGSLAFTVTTADGLHGTLSTQATGGEVLADFAGKVSQFSKTNQVPVELLNQPATGTPTKGVYTLTFAPKEQASPVASNLAPQGTGVATLTLSNTGSVAVAGWLADGTKYSAAAKLRIDRTLPLFSLLYKKRGYFEGELSFEDLADSDVTGTDFLWLRPGLPRAMYYPQGWPNGLTVDALGTKYAKPGSLDFGQGAANPQGGNTALTFSAGLLNQPLVRLVSIDPLSGAVKLLPSNSTGFKLSLAPSTGLFTGTFVHTDGKLDTYRGVLLHKGANLGGGGFFLATPVAAWGASGESGSVTLDQKP